MSRRRHSAALLCLALLSAGCAADTQPQPTPQPPARTARTWSAGPEEVVLRIKQAGGLAPAVNAGPPSVTLYGDGRLVTRRAGGGPAPAMPQLEVRTLTPEATARILNLAREAGLAGATTVADQPVPDGIATIILVRSGDQVSRTVLYGLSPRPGEPTARARLRERARSLLEGLADVESLVGRSGTSAPIPLIPRRLGLSARKVVRDVPPSTDVRPWPTGAGALATLPSPPACEVVSGQAAETLASALTAAPAAVVWEQSGQRWRVTVRPLLPDEAGCS